jgi:sugar phosphate isomerase/epimerase
MKPALSQVSSLHSPFAQDIEDYAAGECRAIDVWLTKLESYLQTKSLEDVRRLRERCGVEFPVASFQGGILASQGDARRVAWELFERRLVLCRELGIATLVVACDVPYPFSQSDLERVQVSLALAATTGQRHGVRIALEFQAASAFGNNLQTAAALVAQSGSAWIGLCLDVFHYYVGPSKPDDLRCLTKENLFHVQLSDISDVPREFAADRDRILPGDGDIPLGPVIQRLFEIEYDGYVSVEVLNPSLWQIPPRQFCPPALAALMRVLKREAVLER